MGSECTSPARLCLNTPPWTGERSRATRPFTVTERKQNVERTHTHTPFPDSAVCDEEGRRRSPLELLVELRRRTRTQRVEEEEREERRCSVSRVPVTSDSSAAASSRPATACTFEINHHHRHFGRSVFALSVPHTVTSSSEPHTREPSRGIDVPSRPLRWRGGLHPGHDT